MESFSKYKQNLEEGTADDKALLAKVVSELNKQADRYDIRIDFQYGDLMDDDSDGAEDQPLLVFAVGMQGERGVVAKTLGARTDTPNLWHKDSKNIYRNLKGVMISNGVVGTIEKGFKMTIKKGNKKIGVVTGKDFK